MHPTGPATASARVNQPALNPQVETHLASAPLHTRKVARCLIVFLLSYATAYKETLTIAHVSGADGTCLAAA